jgi:hydroxyethylthiazole kinase-like uncharacterized protein yjeF
MTEETVGQSLLRKVFIPRRKHAHKGSAGKLLIIGGSETYSGSPALAALAAIRVGVDLTTVLAPKRAADIIASFSPDLITIPLNTRAFTKKHVKEAHTIAAKFDAVVIGGGMGKTKNTEHFVAGFLKNITIPCVIDADAIHALRGKKSLIKQNFVLTPHSYEFFSLTRKRPDLELSKRISLLKKTALSLKCTVLLKGHTDIISTGKQTALNKTGNPFMTKGGTGDSLAGIAGALLAQNVSPFNAACAAAFINGKAGDFAALKYGRSFYVTELINLIPSVLK